MQEGEYTLTLTLGLKLEGEKVLVKAGIMAHLSSSVLSCLSHLVNLDSG